MDYTTEDNDVDMPNAPPLQQATATHCPDNQATQNGNGNSNSMHTHNNQRFPPLLNPWAGLQGGYNISPSVYGTPNMPPIQYGGAAPSYVAAPGYSSQLNAPWSQNGHLQSNAYPGFQDPQYQNLEPPGSRPFRNLPPPVSMPPDYSWAGSNDPRAMSLSAEVNPLAANANNGRQMDYMGHSRTGLSREQALRERRDQDLRAQGHFYDPSRQTSYQAPPSNMPPHVQFSVSSSGWDRPSARQRRFAEAQRDSAGHAAHPNIDSDTLDTDEEGSGHSDDGNLAAIIGDAQFLDMDDDSPAAISFRDYISLSGKTNKRVPSKDFLLSLENLKPEDLSEDERMCKICYNDFGVRNPEGVSEQPIRLPKCQHVFGATCIKQWFKENDSCPYCRDKVPSESSRSLIDRHIRRMVQIEIQRRGGSARAVERGSPYPGSFIPQEHHTTPSTAWARPPTGDAAESRRRVPRGRTGSHRAAHLSSRPISIGGRADPMSMGSARFYSPTSQLQNEVSPQTHSRHNSNSEGLSPAIAVGSTTISGDRHPAPPSINALANSTNPNTWMSSTNSPTANSAVSNSYMSQSAPSYSQNGPSAFGSMRTPAFDPNQHENPAYLYNFRPQDPQQEDSVAFENQQLQLQQQQALQLMMQHNQSVQLRERELQRELREQRENREMEQRANERQFHPHGNIRDY